MLTVTNKFLSTPLHFACAAPANSKEIVEILFAVGEVGEENQEKGGKGGKGEKGEKGGKGGKGETGETGKKEGKAAAKQKVDINAKNDWDLTPLYYACKTEKYDVMEFLIKHGADVNGVLPAKHAYARRVLEMLYENGWKYPYLVTLAHQKDYDALYRFFESAQSLQATAKKAGVDVLNAVDRQGYTAANYVISQGVYALAKVMLSNGAIVRGEKREGSRKKLIIATTGKRP
jgi:ankyrin repeat protein